MEKRCSKCETILPIESFAIKSKASSSQTSYCKSCMQVYCRAHYQRTKAIYNKRRYIRQKQYRLANKIRLRAILASKACIDCGESDPVVLEFDHVRGEKKGEISLMVRRACVWRRIEEELGKCEVRCANCHRRKTARERGWNRDMIGA